MLFITNLQDLPFIFGYDAEVKSNLLYVVTLCVCECVVKPQYLKNHALD